MCQKNKLFNCKFGDADLKDALTGGDGDPDGIEVYEHYGNTIIELCSDFYIPSSLQPREIPKHTLMIF